MSRSIYQPIRHVNRLEDIFPGYQLHASAMCPITRTAPGMRMRAARLRVGLTQPQLAAVGGIAQSAISEFEKGKRADMGAQALTAICRALHVTVEYILLGDGLAQSDEEAEAVHRLRSASPELRAAALRTIRAMLGELDGPSKHQVVGRH